MKYLKQSILILLCLILLLSGCASKPIPATEPVTDLEFIFVHGLSGWGHYDKRYQQMPYWGMFGGDLIEYLNGQGYPSYAASVAPEGSAWDRACELYAQLSGTMTDYGKEHSERCGHPRYGRDFSQEPLVPDWQGGRSLVLLGHSFGGITVRLFAELMANGSEEERNATAPDDLSDFFKGGQGERIFALVTLAAPTNGTTAYDLHEDESFDVSAVKVSGWDEFMGKIFNSRKRSEPDGRAEYDYAAYDMHIDHALAWNERISTLPDTYYFAIPCSAATRQEDGTWKPDRSKMEGMFRKSAAQMGAYSGTTAGGTVIDESWRENDGLVNTISAGAPFGAPAAEYAEGSCATGIWYVMPVHDGDHMSLQGGMTKRQDVKPLYMELLSMIDRLN